MIALCAVALPLIGFAAGVWYGQRRCREDYAEQYRVAVAAQKLREHHRINAERSAYRKVSLVPRPVADRDIMKVSLN